MDLYESVKKQDEIIKKLVRGQYTAGNTMARIPSKTMISIPEPGELDWPTLTKEVARTEELKKNY